VICRSLQSVMREGKGSSREILGKRSKRGTDEKEKGLGKQVQRDIPAQRFLLERKNGRRGGGMETKKTREDGGSPREERESLRMTKERRLKNPWKVCRPCERGGRTIKRIKPQMDAIAVEEGGEVSLSRDGPRRDR